MTVALINPGLGEALMECVTEIQALENAAGDDSVRGAAIKAVLCRTVLTIASVLDRGDGTNALDYDDAGRTAWENHYKRITTGLIATLLSRLNSPPVRTWAEVSELAGVLSDLVTGEDTQWRREIVQLGDAEGVT